jgi:L-lactate dehydrogenase complex protein LldG
MSSPRDEIIARIRTSLGRGPLAEATAASLENRMAAHARNLVPARAQSLDAAARIDLFVAFAREVEATVMRVAHAGAVPGAVAAYLAERNLPASMVMTPDPLLDDIAWAQAPMLAIRRGRAVDGDAVGLSAAFAGIAETGTLMLLSGPASPTSNNFLPDTHIVVLRSAAIVGAYEEAWDRLRQARRGDDGAVAMPRVVNFITGPSRTADIAQRLELGMHGPRRLAIVLVEDGDGGTPAER